MEVPKLPAENYTDHTKNDPQPQPEAKKKNEDAVKAVEHMQPPPQYSQKTSVSSQTVKLQLRVEAAQKLLEAYRKLPGSEERLKTIKIINEVVAELIKEKALAGKRCRRKLTGWNIFTKRRSLENMLGRDFDDDEEFVAYVIDNKVFKYQSGKERRRKLNQLKKKNKTSVVGKMCLQKTGDEFNNLTPERSKFYDSLAEWLTKNRDEEMN